MNKAEHAQHNETLTEYIVLDYLDNYFEDQVPVRWTDYVDRKWVKRQVVKHRAFYARDNPVVAEVVADFEEEVIAQHMQPVHCRGQRQLKLVTA